MSIFGCIHHVYLINSSLQYEGTLKYLGESVTGSKFGLWKNDRVLAQQKKKVGGDTGTGAVKSW